MRRTTINSGFFICFIANLIVNWEWGFIAVLLWGFSYWFNLSWYPAADGRFVASDGLFSDLDDYLGLVGAR